MANNQSRKNMGDGSPITRSDHNNHFRNIVSISFISGNRHKPKILKIGWFERRALWELRVR